MHLSRRRTYVGLLLCLGLFAVALWLIVKPTPPMAILFKPSPAQEVRTARRAATEAETFRFATDLAQTTYPALALANVGRSSRTETMRIEGSYDRPQKLILMNLWNGGGNLLNPQDALELRVLGDQAEGRVSGGDWQPVDNVADAFAPSGDFLGFLAGARNIRRQTVAGRLPWRPTERRSPLIPLTSTARR